MLYFSFKQGCCPARDNKTYDDKTQLLEARLDDKSHEVSRLQDVIKRTQEDAEHVEVECVDALAHKWKRLQREG